MTFTLVCYAQLLVSARKLDVCRPQKSMKIENNVRAFFLLRKILIGGKVDPFLPSMNEPRVGWLVAVSAKKYANKYDTVPYGRR